MSLADDYRRQYEWRAWDEILAAVPLEPGQTVLDLGCAAGDLSEQLVARGARVIGFDGNEDLLAVARSKNVEGAEFRVADLRALPDLPAPVDGIWSSFAAAYFPDLRTVLGSWKRCLRPGGWIATTEVDDMFDHGPLSADSKKLLRRYTRDSAAAGRYDFCMGRRLEDELRAAGFRIQRSFTVDDAELSFQGPASPAVTEAWRARFARLHLLQEFCGASFERVREEFLACLGRPDHRCGARVCCSIAFKPGSA